MPAQKIPGKSLRFAYMIGMGSCLLSACSDPTPDPRFLEPSRSIYDASTQIDWETVGPLELVWPNAPGCTSGTDGTPVVRWNIAVPHNAPVELWVRQPGQDVEKLWVQGGARGTAQPPAWLGLQTHIEAKVQGRVVATARIMCTSSE